jgi:hypothetical protein
MFRYAIGLVLFSVISIQAYAVSTIKVKRDQNWPDLKVAIDNNWPDCKIKFEDNWPDVVVTEDNNWPDIKVKKDTNWPDIKVKEDRNWPDVKVGGTRNLILAAAACPGAQKAAAAAKRKADRALQVFFGIAPMNRQCDSDADCPGFANSCFAGRCTNP